VSGSDGTPIKHCQYQGFQTKQKFVLQGKESGQTRIGTNPDTLLKKSYDKNTIKKAKLL